MCILIPAIQTQQVLTNIQFDCTGRLGGHYRDGRYCDVFHGCIAGVQKISYGCPQVEERFYFDDASQKYVESISIVSTMQQISELFAHFHSDVNPPFKIPVAARQTNITLRLRVHRQFLEDNLPH